MGLIIDTSVLIRYERLGQSDLFARYAADYKTAYISSITVSELLVGVHLADTEARRNRRKVFVEGLLNLLPALDFTAEVARIHADIYASLRQRGALIGAHDLIIAATALQHGFAVLTGNQGEFARVAGLEVLGVEH